MDPLENIPDEEMMPRAMTMYPRLAARLAFMDQGFETPKIRREIANALYAACVYI